MKNMLSWFRSIEKIKGFIVTFHCPFCNFLNWNGWGPWYIIQVSDNFLMHCMQITAISLYFLGQLLYILISGIYREYGSPKVDGPKSRGSTLLICTLILDLRLLINVSFSHSIILYSHQLLCLKNTSFLGKRGHVQMCSLTIVTNVYLLE